MRNSSKILPMPFMRIAIVGILLLGGAGLAQAQSQGKGNTAAVPEISAASPAAQDPGVNPNAAGTAAGDIRSGRAPESVKGAGEHGGSKNLSANTHPLAAAKANRQLRRRHQTEQSLKRQIGGSGQAQQGSASSFGR
jgi:hypothetical protein